MLLRLVVVAAGKRLARLALAADKRGWIYQRSKSPPGSGSLAAMRATAVLDPKIAQVIDEVASVRLVIDESGEFAFAQDR